MAKRLPTQIFIGAYHGVEVADDIQKMVTDAEWDSKELIVTNAAVAKCDIAGKTTVRELGSQAALEAAAEGALLGGLLGSFSLLTIGASGAAKQIQDEMSGKKPKRHSTMTKLAAAKIEGMDKGNLAKLGQALKPGTSAVILVFDEVMVSKADYEEKMHEEKETREAIAELVFEKIRTHLAKGNDIAFHICLDDNGLHSTRTVVGKDATQVRDIVLGQDLVAVNQVTTTTGGREATDAVIITPEAMATARTRLTSTIEAYEVSAIIGEGEDQEYMYSAGAKTADSAAYETAVVNKDGAAFEKGYEATAADEHGMSYEIGHEKTVITANTLEHEKETVSIDVTVEETTKAIEDETTKAIEE